MNGHPDPYELALWAGGDCDPDSIPGLLKHLEICSECRRVAGDFASTQEFFKSALPEPSEADLKSIRRAITKSLEERTRRALRYWSLGGAVAALLVLFAGISGRKPLAAVDMTPPIELPISNSPVHFSLEIPKPIRTVQKSTRGVTGHLDAGLRAASFLPRGEGSFEIKLITANPEVIILLPPIERSVEQ